jgi:hypothetical protein
MRPRLAHAAAALLAAAALAGSAALAVGQTGSSGPQISRSTDAVAGRTVVAWAGPFARFQADRARPSDCARGQRGLVFFIPGATGTNQRTDCTVPAGQQILVSPAWFICHVPQRGFCTDTARINDVRRVRVTIDGAPVTVRQFDWVSQSIPIEGRPAAVAGYVYIIGGLTPGDHTIATSATTRLGRATLLRRMTASVTVQ